MDESPDSLPSKSENYGGVTDSSGPVTFRDLGIDINPTTRRTIFGKVQTFSTLKRQELAFLILAALSFLTSIALTIERLINLENESDDYTFAILLCVATVFCYYYAVGGIFLERPFELLVCICSTIIVALYTVLNFVYGVKGTIKLVRMVLALVLGSVLVTTGSKIGWEYYRSRDLILRTVGANIRLQTACSVLFMTSSLMGFDLQLGISMLIFVMKNGINLGKTEEIVLGIGVPFSILWLIMGYLCLRFEIKSLAVIFVLTAGLEPAYIIYKFFEVKGEDDILKYSTIICGATALLVRLLLVLCAIVAIRNFGKGLKEKVYGQTTPPRGSIASS